MKKLLCSTVIILFCLINKSYSGSHEWVKLAPSKSVIKSMIDLGSIKIGMRGKDLIYNNFGGYTSKGMTNIEFIYKEFALIMPRNFTNFNEYYNNYFFVLKKDKKKFKKGCTPVIEHWACYYGVVAIYDNIIDAHDYLLENVTVNKFKTAKEVIKINGTKKAQAYGYSSITGLTIPIDQLSSVIIWKSEYIEFPIVPNQSLNF